MLKVYSKSKILILGTVLLIVFLAEVLVMAILTKLRFDSVFEESIVDGILLALISAPFIYHFLIKDISIKNAKLIESLKLQKEAEEALRLSQDELQRLSDKLIQSGEEQRRVIAYELHDSIGQSIFAIKLSIENMLQKHASSLADPVKKGLLDQLVKLQNACEEVRNISMNLRPSMLDDLGLLAAIKWLVREFRKLYPDIDFDLSFEVNESDVPLQLKIVIFRVIQESLNNMGKHAQANKVKIELSARNKNISLVIKDDGQGFELGEIHRGEGIGLTSMKERTKLSKGTFRVKSKPAGGTTIYAQWSNAIAEN